MEKTEITERTEISKIIDEYVKEKKLVNYVLRPFYGIKTIPFGAFLLCVEPEHRLEVAETFFNFDEKSDLEKFLVEIGKKYDLEEDIPYDGAKTMYLISDIDDKEIVRNIVLDTYNGLKK